MAHGLFADLAVLFEAGFQRHCAQKAADKDDHVHPHDVAEGTHDGKAVGHQGRHAVTHGGQQHQHVRVGGQGAERTVLLLLAVDVVAVLLRRLDAHGLHVGHAQQDGQHTGAHGGDLRAHEVGQCEHHRAGGHTGKGQIGHDALEAFAAKGHSHHNEGDDQHAEHVDASHHGGVQRHGAQPRVSQGRAAVDGGQARAAPGARRGVAQQGQSDGRDGVEAQRHQERGRDSRRCACTGRALQKDGQHHTDDDHLRAAVVADAGNGALDLVNRAGGPQQVQDHEGAEHHQHDLQSLLDALPQQGVIHGHVLLERRAGHVEVCKGQHQRPDQCHRGDAPGGLAEPQNTHQHNNDRTQCHHKIQETHGCFLTFYA